MKIEARDIKFAYKGYRPTLDGVWFTLDTGEMCALLGRNGAGKTTLFKLLLGLMEPDSGEVLLDGRDIREWKPNERARKISYIPQFSHMEFDYSVMETVLMGASPRLGTFSSPGEKDKERAHELLKLFNLDGKYRRGINEISGGERQMVLICRSLMQDSSLIILDEPTAALDYGNQLFVLETMEKLSEKGVGLLYSTHNPDHALMFSSRIDVMDDRHITFSGTKRELAGSKVLESLYSRPLGIRQISEEGGRERFICIPK